MYPLAIPAFHTFQESARKEIAKTRRTTVRLDRTAIIKVPVPGIYISYPFCSQKCTFCNFASGVFPRELEAKYQDALTQEIRAHEWEWTPDTVYLGGGTPSLMDPTAILAELPGREWREATIEAAPGTLDITHWRAAGLNRVSLGVQSFVTAELRRTGRRHTAETVVEEVAMLRNAGFDNINIDLIAGLPLQTEASWRESLDWIERIGPTHVSVYMFEVDEDSRLGSEILLGGKRYSAMDTPSDDATAAMYETAVERLAAMGIARYEISNFARPGYESVHNLKYWELKPYVGFGADAHSFDGKRRWQNPESLEDYLREHLREYSDSTPDEKFFVGLRLMAGVQPNAEEWQRYGPRIDRLVNGGMLERDETHLRLTPQGVLLSNEIFQEFLTA
jgi:oxygen-independent coproporphyrinogen-3 oxidase